MHRRTVVVQQARHQIVAAAGAAADPVRGLQHGDLDAVPGQGHRTGKAVRAGTDHHRPYHQAPTRSDGLAALRLTSAGGLNNADSFSLSYSTNTRLSTV